MSVNADSIIQVNVNITSAGLSTANFGEAVMFAPESELPVDFDPDTYREYTSLSELGGDFASTTETYKAMNRWLGGIPSTRKVKVWGVADADATWTDTLNKVRDSIWWYWSFFTASVYASASDVQLIAAWHDANTSFFMNSQTGTAVTAIRNPALDTDIASVLTTSGYRHTATFAHATDPYAGNALAKWFAAVNYNGTNTTITGEYKKLSGVAAEDLTSTANGAMKLATKKAMFYSVVDLQGSTDAGRVINSFTHSTYGEYLDDVVNLDVFVNYLTVRLYNVIATANTKVPQTPIGQSLLIGRARAVCEQFVENGYLGPRNYTDPDDGVEKYTAGYEILTAPEDILDLTEVQRANRESAPLRIRIFRAGAIHTVPVDVYVY